MILAVELRLEYDRKTTAAMAVFFDKMKHIAYIYGSHCVLVILVITKYCYTINPNAYGKYEFGICPAKESKFRDFLKIPIRDCVQKCATRPVCKQIGYNRRFQACSLHYETSEHHRDIDNPGCVRVKMETVDIVKLSGGCDCPKWQVCDVETGGCVIEECSLPLDFCRKEAGNMAYVGAVKRIHDEPAVYSECKTTGKWSDIPQHTDDTVRTRNIALHKPASQSSQSNHVHGADLAVDGNRDQNYFTGTCFHTQAELNPWWRVDLQAVSYIKYVRLYNRIDNNIAFRAYDIRIDVGHTDESLHQVAFISGILPDIPEDIQMPENTYGRIFQITRVDIPIVLTPLPFHLCEVEVYGCVCRWCDLTTK